MVISSTLIVWIYATLPVVSIDDVAIPNRNKPMQALDEKNLIKVFYIILNDEGKMGQTVGCGDSVVGIYKEIPATTTPLSVALSLLFSDKNETATSTRGELFNAVAKSNLKIKKIQMKSATSTDVYLAGSISSGGVCDNPRIQAQILNTAQQFGGIQKVNVFINNKTLEEALSSK